MPNDTRPQNGHFPSKKVIALANHSNCLHLIARNYLPDARNVSMTLRQHIFVISVQWLNLGGQPPNPRDFFRYGSGVQRLFCDCVVAVR